MITTRQWVCPPVSVERAQRGTWWPSSFCRRKKSRTVPASCSSGALRRDELGLSEAAIPVEKIQGDILFLGGAEDRFWPSTLMADQIIALLSWWCSPTAPVTYRSPGPGTASPFLPGDPTAHVAERLGGTPRGNAEARERGVL